ncbi:hypothetical protein QC764_0081310 [Podospora pseudoanserina]|uniref:Uncharacterized protein n=1 Tax=Podospora pseudoanserina TaxID=2609844 RepID=A0ABR0I5W9_9PEZI|nr:hypothetical protein QC764_0081310 [Podospora pseudoanserina]
MASVWPSPGLDRKGNNQRAEAVLFRAQQCIELGHLSKAWKLVGQWTPCHAAQPSSLQTVMSSRLDFMKGKLHRFQGNFGAARQYLEPLSSQALPSSELNRSGPSCGAKALSRGCVSQTLELVGLTWYLSG